MFVCPYDECHVELPEHDMRAHLLVVHFENYRPYKCQRCDQKFPTEQRFVAHHEQMHANFDEYQFEVKFSRELITALDETLESCRQDHNEQQHSFFDHTAESVTILGDNDDTIQQDAQPSPTPPPELDANTVDSEGGMITSTSGSTNNGMQQLQNMDISPLALLSLCATGELETSSCEIDRQQYIRPTAPNPESYANVTNASDAATRQDLQQKNIVNEPVSTSNEIIEQAKLNYEPDTSTSTINVTKTQEQLAVVHAPETETSSDCKMMETKTKIMNTAAMKKLSIANRKLGILTFQPHLHFCYAMTMEEIANKEGKNKNAVNNNQPTPTAIRKRKKLASITTTTMAEAQKRNKLVADYNTQLAEHSARPPHPPFTTAELIDADAATAAVTLINANN